VKAIKVVFTTDYTIDETSGAKIEYKELHVRTIFFDRDQIDDTGFQGLSRHELKKIQWSPWNLAGIPKSQLDQYLNIMNVQELLIESSSGFTEDKTFKNLVSVSKIGE